MTPPSASKNTARKTATKVVAKKAAMKKTAPKRSGKASNRSVIKIEQMNKWYGNFHVLRDINLEVYEGADRYLRAVRVWQIHADSLY